MLLTWVVFHCFGTVINTLPLVLSPRAIPDAILSVPALPFLPFIEADQKTASAKIRVLHHSSMQIDFSEHLILRQTLRYFHLLSFTCRKIRPWPHDHIKQKMKDWENRFLNFPCGMYMPVSEFGRIHAVS